MSRDLDDVDREILRLLREDARRPIKEIAARINLSAAPTKRRINRLERVGVIVGYTVQIDEARIGLGLEAFTELRYAGHMEQDEILTMLTSIEEVDAAYALAGDTDALVHIRAEDVAHLQRVIAKLRSRGNPVTTRTLVVIESRLGEARQRRLAQPRG